MSGGLGKIGQGVNIRSGFGTASPVIRKTTRVEYCEITSVNRALDDQGYLWLKGRFVDGAEGWSRIDLFQGLIGDFTPWNAGIYDGWTPAMRVFPGSQPAAAAPAGGTAAPATSTVTAIGLAACPVRPCTNTNDFGNVYAGVSHEGVDCAGPASSDVKAGVKGVVIRAMRSQYGQASFSERGIALNNPSALNDYRWGYGLGNHVVLRVAWADLPGSAQSALVTAGMRHAYVYVAFGHLQDLSVTEGQLVDGGTVLGHCGHSGNANGDHLHLETRISDALDPANPFDDTKTTKFSPHWLYDVPKQGQVYS